MADSGLARVERTYGRIGRRWAWNALSFAGFQGWESVLRRRAVEHLALRPGSAVLDVACGRGSNFPYLERAVGREGRIVGLDYSPEMLAGAADLVKKRGWANVTLVRGDAAKMTYRKEFDAAVCTLAMTVIPRWQEALSGMVSAVRPGNSVVILDGRLREGPMRVWNPFARLFARIVAADLERDVAGACARVLVGAREERFLFAYYFIVSGRAPSAGEGT